MRYVPSLVLGYALSFSSPGWAGELESLSGMARAGFLVPPILAPLEPVESTEEDRLARAQAAENARFQEVLKRLKKNLGKTEIGKTILERIEGVPIVIDRSMWGNYVARYVSDGDLSYIGFGADWKKFSEGEMEFTLLHEGSHACVDLPGEFCDDEQLAYQRELEYALQKSEIDAEFGKTLRRWFGRFRDLERTRVKVHGGRGGTKEEKERYSERFHRLHQDVRKSWIGRIAQSLETFHRQPGLFYWRIQKQYSFSPHHVTLTEIEDFLEIYGDRLDSFEGPREDGFYYRIDGKRYRWAVIQRAREVQGAGGVEEIRRRLGDFDDSGMKALQRDIEHWYAEES